MKILLSPSKEVDTSDFEKRINDVNTQFFNSKLEELHKKNIHFEDINVLSKKAIKLYKGLAFRQLTDLDNVFYKDVIILSSLYGYSYGGDYISNYRLDYTTMEGRLYRKEMYVEINKVLQEEDVIYNLASKEFSKGIMHSNLVSFEFLVLKNDKLKNISATSKKMRGKMVEFIKNNGENSFEDFSCEGFCFTNYDSKLNTYTYTKSEA